MYVKKCVLDVSYIIFFASVSEFTVVLLDEMVT